MKNVINLVLIIICTLEIAFTATTFVFTWNGISVPDNLIMYWHITFVSELFACAGIKVTKTIKEAASTESEEVVG